MFFFFSTTCWRLANLLTTSHQVGHVSKELLQMIKDVVTLSGDPAVLTSQLDGQLDSPEIFASGIQQKKWLKKGRDWKSPFKDSMSFNDSKSFKFQQFELEMIGAVTSWLCLFRVYRDFHYQPKIGLYTNSGSCVSVTRISRFMSLRESLTGAIISNNNGYLRPSGEIIPFTTPLFLLCLEQLE